MEQTKSKDESEKKNVYLPSMTQPNKSKKKYSKEGKGQKDKKDPTIKGNFLYSQKFEKLHNMNEIYCQLMQNENEQKWQIFRKKYNKVSNRLDGSYCPKIHTRAWWPNGEYRVKRRYNYTESGLEHFYEKNNVEQKKPIDLPLTKKKDIEYLQDFIEYDKAQPGEYIITIEYCSSCEEHANITQHSSDTIFKDLAIKYQRIIKERFPFITVILKPIDVDIVKSDVYKLPKVLKNGMDYQDNHPINDQFKQCRIGAFEIQISTNKNGVKDTRIIHSKLKTKKFPNVTNVLDKIVSFMPQFKLNLVLYDKEDYEDLDKMNGIQVNIYLCKSNIVKEVGESTEEQVMNFTSPGRRLDMLRMKRFVQGQNLFKNTDSLFFKRNKRIVSSIPGKHRGFSAASSLSSRPVTSTNFNQQHQNTNKNMISSENLSNSNNDIFQNTNNGEDLLLEEELLKSQKGVLIKKKFSKVEKNENNKEEDDERSESVTLKFDSLSYDTYIIETVENCNFQSSWTLLKFNQINTNNPGEITKFIGLWHQKKAILNIHLFMEKEIFVPKKKDEGDDKNENNIENGNENMTKVYDQEPVTDATITISTADDPNSRYKVYPNLKGIYEYMTKPGEYKLEIIKKDCEKIVEKIKIQCGLNTKNIKLIPAKHCDLVVQVLEYSEYTLLNNNRKNEYIQKSLNKFRKQEEKKEGEGEEDEHTNIITEPVRNAEVQIFRNSNDLLVEGITNRKGIMKYLVDKNENNLSIKVNKHGYFRAERFFKKSAGMKENEGGNYDCIMTFILVKKEILENCNKILFVLYTNMCKKIFDLEVNKYDSEEDDEELNHFDIKDMQQKSGILIASLWYFPQKREEDEVIMDEHYNQSLNHSKKKEVVNENNPDGQENVNENEINEEDFKEETYYKEIVRIGLNVSPNVICEEDSLIDTSNITPKDLIEYLRDICCEGNIYTPNYDFHINLPKLLSDNIITEKNEDMNIVEGDNNNKENNNDENNMINKSNSNNNRENNSGSNSSLKNKKVQFKGLYWDLGWLDLKNHLYYETSCNFHIDYKPDRLVFFEKFLEFLQVFIDKKLYDSLFSFFNFDNSVLAGSDRYLPNKTFQSILNEMLIDENSNVETSNDEEKNKEIKEKIIEKQNFIQFISNILCGFDEELNIRDDSISYNLLRKKISSNLKNFNNLNGTSIDNKQSTNGLEYTQNGA
jgi:hypothetical protein